MPADVILFKVKLNGKLSEKRTAIPLGALLVVLLLSAFFLAILSGVSYLNACTIGGASALIAWPAIILIRRKTRHYTLHLTREALCGIDRKGIKDILLALGTVTHFRYYSMSFDEDDYHRMLQAITPQGVVDLPLSALTRSREEQLLLCLRRAGFTVFLVYENQELGNTYPGI